MRLAVIFAALVIDGCCCSVERVRRVDASGCFYDEYNCQVSPLTRIGTVACPPEERCALAPCLTVADCADAGTGCRAAVTSTGTTFCGGTFSCSADGGSGGSCVLATAPPGSGC